MIGFIILLIFFFFVLPIIIIMTVYNLLKQKINKKILIFICLTIIIFEIIFLTRTWQNFVHLN